MAYGVILPPYIVTVTGGKVVKLEKSTVYEKGAFVSYIVEFRPCDIRRERLVYSHGYGEGWSTMIGNVPTVITELPRELRTICRMLFALNRATVDGIRAACVGKKVRIRIDEGQEAQRKR